MDNTRIDAGEAFVERLCREIQYKPIHPAVSEEYRVHLAERTGELMEEGYDPESALREAVARMGDPAEIGQALNKAHRPRMDYPTLFLTGALITAGLLVQLFLRINTFGLVVSTGLGLLLMVGLIFLDYRRLQVCTYPIFFLCTVLLMARVMDAGYFYHLDYNTVRKIPTLLTPLLIVSFAGILTRAKTTWFPLLAAVALLIPALMVNIPTGMVFGCTFFAMLLAGQPHGKAIKKAVIFVGTFGLLFLGRILISNAYVKERIAAFLQPERYQYTSGYAASVLNRYSFFIKPFGSAGTADTITVILPDSNTNYVLMSVAARWGWVLALGVAVLVVLFLFRMGASAKKIRDGYGKIICVGVFAAFAAQIAFSLPVNTGQLPASSILLPFLAYDNIGFIANAAAVGLLLGVYRRKDLTLTTSHG